MLDPNSLVALPLVKDIAAHDQMAQGHLGHYFGVGLSAIWTLENVLRGRESLLQQGKPIQSILDFGCGCGCGRIGRFLRARFPTAELSATDFRKSDVDWYVKHFDAALAPDTLPPDTYDLIWLGSVFTHLSEAAATALLAKLLPSLRADGVLTFSTQGRFSYEMVRNATTSEAEANPWLAYNLIPSLRQELVAGYERTGYGYVEYPGDTGYGVCIADPIWYSNTVFGLADVTQIFFQERGLDDHQDVVGFMRRGLRDSRTMRFVQMGRAIAG